MGWGCARLARRSSATGRVEFGSIGWFVRGLLYKFDHSIMLSASLRVSLSAIMSDVLELHGVEHASMVAIDPESQ